MSYYASVSRQRGATLLVAMVMLVVMTLLAVTSFNLGKGNLQMVGNMQTRVESANAAKAAIEEVISKDFTITPSAALGSSNSKSYDVNGDGTADVTVTLTPAPCVMKAQLVKNAQLIMPEQSGCSTDEGQKFGIPGAVTGDSLCSDAIWQIQAVATDSVTQASRTITQGIAVRGQTSSSYCP